MIAIDSNILIYAHRRDSIWHEPASRSIDDLVASNRPWMIPWPCIHEFYSISTNPKIYEPASTTAEAISQINHWLESPTLSLQSEGIDYWSTLQDWLQRLRIVGPQVHDARIAVICATSGVDELWSADRDFSRFAQIKVVNPLVRD